MDLGLAEGYLITPSSVGLVEADSIYVVLISIEFSY